jgi:CubicO group peptidase (beta-lactamase class C family)
MAWARNEYTVQDLIDAFKDKRSSFEPGQKTVYSNSNYVLLGAIIEEVSGVSFNQFVKANLFGPLGMTSTSCEGRFDDIPGLATAYEPARTPDNRLDWGRLLVARPYTMSALYTAGGCVSSVEDLGRFHEGLFRDGIVGRRALSESFEPARLNGGSAGTMSLGGWQLDTVQGRRPAARRCGFGWTGPGGRRGYSTTWATGPSRPPNGRATRSPATSRRMPSSSTLA